MAGDATDPALTIDGRTVAFRAGASIIQARLEAGFSPDVGAGCVGHGSCGSCRAMVRRTGGREVEMVLACETDAEPGMVVSLLSLQVDDAACPRNLSVHQAVVDAAAGRLSPAAAAFDECVMCDLCTVACPEQIDPNHLGMFARRVRAGAATHPAELLVRLRDIERGSQAIDLDVVDLPADPSTAP